MARKKLDVQLSFPDNILNPSENKPVNKKLKSSKSKKK